MTEKEIDYDNFFDVQDRIDFLDGNKSYEYDSSDEMDDEFYESFRIVINPDYKKDQKKEEEKPDELDMLVMMRQEENNKKRNDKKSNKI
jgi:hypothetical protein